MNRNLLETKREHCFQAEKRKTQKQNSLNQHASSFPQTPEPPSMSMSLESTAAVVDNSSSALALQIIPSSQP